MASGNSFGSDSDLFITVSKKKAGKAKKLHYINSDHQEAIPVDQSLRNILRAKIEIESSVFYHTFLSALQSILDKSKKDLSEITCLGLGRISSCRTAQYQLGLILLLQEHFLCATEVYDPVFSASEKVIISELKLKVSEHNCEGKIISNSTGFTLFVFPHCPKELSNNLLWVNWKQSHLANCILYGNSFEKIHLDTPHRFLKSYEFLIKSLEVVREISVPNVFHVTDIFNDLSLHYFPENLIAQIPSSFWEAVEPDYPEESELVKDVS
nr:EOG090X0FII [Scapholeberis mucronata]